MSIGSRSRRLAKIANASGETKDKNGVPKSYSVEAVESCLMEEVENGFIEKAKIGGFTPRIEIASNSVKSFTGLLVNAMDEFNVAELKLTESIKKSSGTIKDSAHRLKDGLEKVEKIADFEKLEKMACTLERISNSLSILAELAEAGKLSRIIDSIK
jgi:hypothetical protein